MPVSDKRLHTVVSARAVGITTQRRLNTLNPSMVVSDTKSHLEQQLDRIVELDKLELET